MPAFTVQDDFMTQSIELNIYFFYYPINRVEYLFLLLPEKLAWDARVGYGLLGPRG